MRNCVRSECESRWRTTCYEWKWISFISSKCVSGSGFKRVLPIEMNMINDGTVLSAFAVGYWIYTETIYSHTVADAPRNTVPYAIAYTNSYRINSIHSLPFLRRRTAALLHTEYWLNDFKKRIENGILLPLSLHIKYDGISGQKERERDKSNCIHALGIAIKQPSEEIM